MSDSMKWMMKHRDYELHNEYERHEAEYTYQYDYSVNMSDKQKNTRSRIYIQVTSKLKWCNFIVTDNTMIMSDTEQNTHINVIAAWIWATSSRIQEAEHKK